MSAADLPPALVMLAAAATYMALLRSNTAVEEARALAFIVLVTGNAVLIFPNRSARPDWQNLFSGLSRISLWVLASTAIALLVIVSVPGVAEIFKFSPPPLQHALLALAAGIALLLPLQGMKYWLAKKLPPHQ